MPQLSFEIPRKLSSPEYFSFFFRDNKWKKFIIIFATSTHRFAPELSHVSEKDRMHRNTCKKGIKMLYCLFVILHRTEHYHGSMKCL